MKKIMLSLLIIMILSGCGWNRWEMRDRSPTTYKQRHDAWIYCEETSWNDPNLNYNKNIDLVPFYGLIYTETHRVRADVLFKKCMDEKGYYKKW